jgi:rhodanese-related sulfurtransferase
MKRIAALALLAAAVAVLAIGEPDVDRRLAKVSAALDDSIAAREYHIDPAELLELMHNRQVQLYVLDVRDEAQYNLFHLVDSRRVSGGDEGIQWIKGLPAKAVKVIVADDDDGAAETWKRATAVNAANVYILDGGINAWLRLYFSRDHDGVTANADIQSFSAALGSRHVAAYPAIDHFEGHEFTKKVRIVLPVSAPTGGCGG